MTPRKFNQDGTPYVPGSISPLAPLKPIAPPPGTVRPAPSGTYDPAPPKPINIAPPPGLYQPPRVPMAPPTEKEWGNWNSLQPRMDRFTPEKQATIKQWGLKQGMIQSPFNRQPPYTMYPAGGPTGAPQVAPQPQVSYPPGYIPGAPQVAPQVRTPIATSRTAVTPPAPTAPGTQTAPTFDPSRPTAPPAPQYRKVFDPATRQYVDDPTSQPYLAPMAFGFDGRGKWTQEPPGGPPAGWRRVQGPDGVVYYPPTEADQVPMTTNMTPGVQAQTPTMQPVPGVQAQTPTMQPVPGPYTGPKLPPGVPPPSWYTGPMASGADGRSYPVIPPGWTGPVASGADGIGYPVGPGFGDPRTAGLSQPHFDGTKWVYPQSTPTTPGTQQANDNQAAGTALATSTPLTTEQQQALAFKQEIAKQNAALGIRAPM